MEVTPLDPRDLHVSSGDGAKPHGRDMSPPKEDTKAVAKAATANQPPLEVPKDVTQDDLAASLEKASPQLDPIVARKIAKALLAHPAHAQWVDKPTPARDATAPKSQVDIKA